MAPAVFGLQRQAQPQFQITELDSIEPFPAQEFTPLHPSLAIRIWMEANRFRTDQHLLAIACSSPLGLQGGAGWGVQAA